MNVLVENGRAANTAPSDSACRAAHGGYAAVVAVGQFLQRSALRAPSGGLFLLCRGQRRGAAHMLSSGFGTAPAFGGTGADKIPLHVRQPAENGKHQAPGASGGVGP